MAYSTPLQEFDFELALPKASAHRSTLSSYGGSRNSSLNTKEVWAEDYFESGREELAETEGQGWVTPRLTAVTTSKPYPGNMPICAEEDNYLPTPLKANERSLTALLPFRNPRSGESSPKKLVKERKGSDNEDSMASLTGDRDAVFRGIGKGGLSSWFTGSSAPVTVGISTQPTSPNQHPAAAPASSPVGASAPPLFSFFSSSKPVPKTIQLPKNLLESDELLTIDIQKALYQSRKQDTFSPAAFKNLQMSAEGLLTKMQTSYQLLALRHHELSGEMSAQEEELEEAEMRAQHLKAQLDDMSKKFSEQDCVIENLVLELAHERQLRAEEKDAREKSIALVKESCENAEKLGSYGSSHPEDLHASTDPRRRSHWRNSNGSTEYESDIESNSESVFSRSRSPSLTVMSATSTMTCDSSPEILQAAFGRVVTLKDERSGIQRPKLVQQPSTFQKILHANSRTSTGVEENHECANCRGQHASVAWDTVGLLKAENKGLKERVGILEHTVEDALDMCDGLGR